MGSQYHRLITLCCTHYSDVEKQFKIKEECQNIIALTCDLTAETPSVPDVQYQAQVYVNGGLLHRTTNRFKPIADSKNLHVHSSISVFPPSQMYSVAFFIHSSLFVSVAILGPPTLSTYTTVSSLYVNVTLPLGPNRVSVADIIRRSKNGPAKTVIVYILKITEPKWASLVSPCT